MSNFYQQFKTIVNFSEHVDIASTTENIKKGIDFKGPNVWILAFAVIVASVGLNVNSVPVIIGAMLISPLMGPIMGTGLAAGINDYALFKRSLKNLGIMVVISIIASTSYFVISPLSLAEPTELLARTRPTIYDVFIAFFGGLAGIVESARKEKGTVIAGVAIATALMPPLCTAGYGIATGNFAFFGGALYLFSINSLFIALSTFLIIRYLKFPFVQFTDPQKQKRVRRSTSLFIILMIIPSIYTAIMVIQENTFNQASMKFISENKGMENSYIFDYKVKHTPRPSTLELSIAGERLSERQKELLYEKLESQGIYRNQVIIKESSIFDDSQTEETMIKSIFEKNDIEIGKREELIRHLQSRLDTIQAKDIPYEQITKEIEAQHPQILSLSIAKGAEISASPYASKEQIIAIIKWQEPLSQEELTKLEQWMAIRLNASNVKIIQLSNQ